MRIKHLLFPLLISGVVLSGCQKDHSNPVEPGHENAALSADSARTEFSKILSKAVYNEPDLRNFIKVKALEQFDNDYDVFYPFVKDEIVSEGQTFRTILEKYCDDPNTLNKIEEELPLLNILLPDLTAFFEFSADKWNSEEKEIAVLL